MKYIMTIWDIQEIPGRGTALAGVNEEFDSLTEEEIKAAIGAVVVVARSAVRVEVQVLEVMAASSLIGKKNIFILIESLPPAVEIGSSLHTRQHVCQRHPAI